jgi:flagellar biogenesis protein FliO
MGNPGSSPFVTDYLGNPGIFVLAVNFGGTEMETIKRVVQIVGGLACALLAIGALGWSLKSMMKKSKEQTDKKIPQQ